MIGTEAGEQNAIYRSVDRVVSVLENICAILAGIILLFMMVIVSLDAIFRYLFHAPIAFQYTLTEDYLMVAVVSLALSWGFRTGGFIRITGITNMLPGWMQAFVFRLGLVLGFLYVFALAWTSGGAFQKVWTTGEVRIGVIDWPVYLSWIWVPLGCGLLAIRVLLTAFAPAAEICADPHAESEI
ncbi:TRAP transporter small permease [Paracoccus denitrificans]|uniref:TRAP transporter small permease protein n=1 Tax=Paracoccus denitrificans (strain Pd 1222) TaxID=318586 RepID=A1B6Z5_PARDP|nr:TRAP transporter small permease [Paracoccus denitrificans]ABL71289.1 hypothetical protein Pden_3208 [Paracoccus denitrificans PD1222]MBB4629582.1 TRAP-type C4-dicarboxylate transport system permease small subunit [Paracoccus denitrificans]MCU7430978.1 TRAP transporter small permease [Paracoccus denitrificans]QAR27919.1 TRAP transporter small permease [Paracoccus denitrificans]UPV97633.1 TRAP transporter small permease [Paracoccus denitrificans]